MVRRKSTSELEESFLSLLQRVGPGIMDHPEFVTEFTRKLSKFAITCAQSDDEDSDQVDRIEGELRDWIVEQVEARSHTSPHRGVRNRDAL